MKPHWKFFIVWALLNIADWATTMIYFSQGHPLSHEVNELMRWWMQQGMGLATLFKLQATFLIGYWLACVYKVRRWVGNITRYGLNICLAVVVKSNIMELLK